MGERSRLNHYPRCYGCGVANESGLKLAGEWDGEQCLITHLPPHDAEGGPGIVHGGYVGALVDEAMALVASHVTGEPAMTRRIELDFVAPALTQTPLTLRAWVDEERTRAIIVRLAGEQGEPGEPARTCFEAKGVYIKVPGSAWADPMNAASRTWDKLDLSAGDPSNFFRWQLRGFASMYDPAKLDRDVRVAVVISGVTPPEWTITASGSGFDAFEGTTGKVNATLRCDFGTWERLAHDPAAQVSGLAEAGQVSFTGDVSAIEVLLTLFHRHNSPG
jgi:acyl-coenzyme A thioesterase PaaI-like protein